MKKYSMILLILILFSINNSYPDSLLNNINHSIDNLSDDSESSSQYLNQKLTINKSFNSILQVVNVIHNMTQLQTKVTNLSADSVQMVNINQINGTLASFLDQVSKELNFNWSIADNTIIFSPVHPLIPKLLMEKTTLPSQEWTVSTDDKVISVTLNKWARQGGYSLVWDSNEDFQIQTGGTIDGTLRHAINEVLKSFSNTNAPLRANWYQNKVIVITSAGNTGLSSN